MGDPESDRRRPRESVVEERETKRVRINVLDGEESEKRWRPRKNGCESTVVPDEICSVSTTPRADLCWVTFRREEGDVSRSASGVDRKHKIQKVLGGAERTNEVTSRGRLLAGCEGRHP